MVDGLTIIRWWLEDAWIEKQKFPLDFKNLEGNLRLRDNYYRLFKNQMENPESSTLPFKYIYLLKKKLLIINRWLFKTQVCNFFSKVPVAESESPPPRIRVCVTYLIMVGLDNQSPFLSTVLATNTKIVNPTKNLAVKTIQCEDFLWRISDCKPCTHNKISPMLKIRNIALNVHWINIRRNSYYVRENR